MALLLLPPKYWDYGPEAPHPAMIIYKKHHIQQWSYINTRLFHVCARVCSSLMLFYCVCGAGLEPGALYMLNRPSHLAAALPPTCLVFYSYMFCYCSIFCFGFETVSHVT